MDKIIHYKKRVYYAQNREDLILEAFFPDVTEGFYVDIGAYDPDFESVTKYFYLHNWHGINVEPQPDNAKKLTESRPRDINSNVGISNKKSQLTLRLYKNGGLSTFSDRMKSSYAAAPDEETSQYRDVKVQVITLKELFEQYAEDTIHFMKIDVEGLEYEVLEGNDWEKYRPQVLCVEANHIAKDWHGLLKTYDYEKVFFDGLNEYFVDRRTDRSQKFDYVRSVVLEKGGGLNIVDYRVLEDMFEERDEINKYAKHLLSEVEKRNQTIAEQESTIAEQESTIAEQRTILTSIKKTNRNLGKLIRSRLKRSS
jgi:FkbM family methyltransferase